MVFRGSPEIGKGQTRNSAPWIDLPKIEGIEAEYLTAEVGVAYFPYDWLSVGTSYRFWHAEALEVKPDPDGQQDEGEMDVNGLFVWVALFF